GVWDNLNQPWSFSSARRCTGSIRRRRRRTKPELTIGSPTGRQNNLARGVHVHLELPFTIDECFDTRRLIFDLLDELSHGQRDLSSRRSCFKDHFFFCRRGKDQGLPM